jgi:hypothetical protein
MLMAGGWPFSIWSYIRGGDQVPLSRQIPDGEQLLRPLTATANLLGYTVYPVDVPGVSSEAVDATIQTAKVSGEAGMSSKLREQEFEGALRFIAQETGKAVINSNRTLALAEAAPDTRSDYWLGFTPTWKRNDKSHQVKVEAVRPGLTVRARENFIHRSRNAKVSMRRTRLRGSVTGPWGAHSRTSPPDRPSTPPV